MTLVVRCPTSFAAERAYVFDVLLREFLGVDFVLQMYDRPIVEIVLDGRRLTVPDAFLGGDERAWLTPRSLPRSPLPRIDTTRLVRHAGVPAEVPVLFGEATLQLGDAEIQLGVDVFASSFFVLSRYEEAVGSARGKHNRFPARASIAWKEDFLDYPIVNVYVEILWACMHRLWPALKRRPRRARMLVSCDVDLPLDPALRSWILFGKKLAWTLLERDPAAAARLVRDTLAVRQRGMSADPFYTFGDYMTWVEGAELSATFYFIAGHTGGDIDGYYSLDDALIRELLAQVHQRGHEIGLHPSYGTYLSAELVHRELEALQRTCAQLGIRQERWGGRQHYLRWQPETLRHLSDAGLDYDSTLTFAEHAGFRAGVCYEYPAYDLRGRVPLPLRIRPLVAMDVSLLSKRYMALTYDQAAATIARLVSRCAAFDGDFTLLWHNSTLTTDEHRRLFRSVLARRPSPP